MPKVKNPLFSQEARGGLQGLVFNTWRGISTVKSNPSPMKAGTRLRLVAQALLLRCARAWAALEDADRALWDQYAVDHPLPDPINGTKRLTGMNWFCRCTIQLLRMSVAQVDTPPVIAAPDAVVGLVATDNLGALELEWDTPIAESVNLDISIVGPHSEGLVAKVEKARFLASIEDATAQPYVAIAAPIPGRYTVFVKVVSTVNGLTSSLASAFVDIAP